MKEKKYIADFRKKTNRVGKEGGKSTKGARVEKS